MGREKDGRPTGENMGKIKLQQGDFYQGMLVGRRREDGRRELCLSIVIMKNGRPANVLLVKEDKDGYLIPGTLSLD
jgi:hypothetical protein